MLERLNREWLETNGLGGFASSTLAGINTRRYHGLLTAATKPPVGRMVLLSKLEVHSLFDVSIELAGLLGGGFAGAYTLGMFTRRANSPGVAIGIGCSIVLTLVAWHYNLVHPYFYLAISILLCIVIGYLASLLFPAPTRSLNGLTIYRDLD